MHIPEKFKLFNQTIRVIYDINHFIDKEGAYGFANYRRNLIILRPSTELVPVSDEQMEQTFYHELMHFIIYYVGSSYNKNEEGYMHQDECFIDLLSHLLHQALSTAVY